MILGSGLGVLADALEEKVTIPYEELDGFPVSTVAGHSGELVLGKLHGVDVVCMKGRGHYYEHETMKVMTTPVRTFKRLGCELLLVTNAPARCARSGSGSAPWSSSTITSIPCRVPP